MTENMIELDQLTKHYPGQDRPAVTELTMNIAAGEIVVFVGPSGCGKTTTMKLVNRLIEPSSGRIVMQGEDVTSVNPDQLRRRIGYVIQQGGLFPHMTIAENIATVPKMLGWDRGRIAERVDQLLTLVGLDPGEFAQRYPKQLSGGQQQRVGVARALGADPPVMLMDEPFGAIDPVQRENLQNEFLKLQGDIRKTIIFVTHDIDEAIKMGDRIAILNTGAVVAQYDTPERILSDPADEFVADFVGRGASIRRLSLTRVKDAAVPRWPAVAASTDPRRILAIARESKQGWAILLDDARRPIGWVPSMVASTDTTMLSKGVPVNAEIRPEDTLFDALDGMLSSNRSATVVVDEEGRYRGVLDIETVRGLIHSAPEAPAANGSSGK
ncbi:betaine/proline/choline family ABC transporter ATP-binding protein [Pseudonocardia eucalypti]|uniref:Betaine/proline/choline family ABC transporter ATP-binding protein n=1 Tax=Pseudonocardia eucalypti TaxID=648755 RepID=A0ABP9PCA4_9PSEU|nr:osmoprotectant transport system ATP-binding protein [Pseudonocardia eucalypti]